ncbi:MAG: 50S ribosomal protein L9 [Candidatus Delongbacteria bacterium]|nr:50S ribosomal protein L9 [Candidatus Delongbacteria bacterium]MCG2760681.1 50S ribosomal protein L9 [Candidatus Delongbacteria bacterium]
MLIILRHDLDKVGKAGETIKVKDGFARNYLIPNNFAYPATDAYMNRYKEGTKSKRFKEAQTKKSDEFLKKALADKTAVIKMKVGEENKLFGSVTSQNIADELKKYGIEVDKRRILLEENIKHLGEYKVPYKSHSVTEITISVSVIAETE